MRPWNRERDHQSEAATRYIPRNSGAARGSRWPAADPDTVRPYDELATRMMPRVADRPPVSEPIGDRPPPLGPQPDTPPTEAEEEDGEESVAKSSGRMAIATLTSRITGFLWKVMLAWVAGIGVVYDSFTVANTLPLVVNELLLGGVLTTVVVPMLVRAQDDEDGGRRFTQQLITMAGTILLVGAVITTLCAPLIVSLFLSEDTGESTSELATAFAYFLLPGLLFYGMFAVLSAVLNARKYFGPAQWAPVMKNMVIIITIGLYTIVPGSPKINPLEMSDPKVLVLGIGVLTGMTLEALYLVRPLRRSGFRFRPRWGIDSRLREFGGMAAWIFGYVALSQLGVAFNINILSGAAEGSVSMYSNASLLFQLPYGVIGVSLLTAVMPRMSRAAADSDYPSLVGDLSYASRLNTLLLLPISAIMVVAGPSIGIALFGIGETPIPVAEQLGLALAVAALGLLPFALVMLQMRVFYAMKDARTPTLIMVVMTGVKILLLYLAAAVLPPKDVILGVMLAEALVWIVGATMGQVWLWVKLGNLRSRRVVGVIVFTVGASGVGALAALLVGFALPDSMPPVLGSWVRLVLQGIVGVGVAFGLLIAMRVDEFAPVTNRVKALLRRG